MSSSISATKPNILRETIRNAQGQFATAGTAQYFHALDRGEVVAYVQQDLAKDGSVTQDNLKEKIQTSIKNLFSVNKEAAIIGTLENDFQFDHLTVATLTQKNVVDPQDLVGTNASFKSTYATLQKETDEIKKENIRKDMSDFFQTSIDALAEKLPAGDEEIISLTEFLDNEIPGQQEALKGIIGAYQDDLDHQKQSVTDELETTKLFFSENDEKYAAVLLQPSENEVDINAIIQKHSALSVKIDQLNADLNTLTNTSEKYGSLLQLFEANDKLKPSEIRTLLNELKGFTTLLANNNLGKRVFLGKEFFAYAHSHALLPNIHCALGNHQAKKSPEIILTPEHMEGLQIGVDAKTFYQNLAEHIITMMDSSPKAALVLPHLEQAHYTIHSVLTNPDERALLQAALVARGRDLIVKEGITQDIEAKGNCLLDTALVCLRNVEVVNIKNGKEAPNLH